jgi:DNA polymerase-3 subunit gamma/tau
MSYLVTARKWRPQTFDEVVGQEHITTTLKNAIKNNRIAHAYIFAGPRGVGKTTTARIFAKRLNCLSPADGEPCNKCSMCEAYNESQSLDIIEIDGASNRRIEEIRTLRESVKYAPTKGQYKIYIIDEVHMLTTESFNALLKTLEEPPDKTVFIFATTDVHKVPLTIISRCQRFDFRRIELNAIIDCLGMIAKNEKINIDETSLTIISKKADGALRDAQSLFDQVISFCGTDVDSVEVARMLNLIDDEIYFEVSEAIISKDYKKAFEISQQIYDNGWNYIDFLNGLIEHFRNIMTVIIRDDDSLIEAPLLIREKYLSYSDKFSEGDMLRILNFLNRVQYELKSSHDQKLKIEVSLCHLIGLERSSTISELLSNLGKVTPTTTQSKKKAIVNPELKPAEPRKKEAPSKRPITLATNKAEAENEEPTGDFGTIAAQWNLFIERINSEKFTLGSHMVNSFPLNLENGILKISVDSKDDIDIIKNNNSYLDCLKVNFNNLFGMKLNFDFTSEEPPSIHNISDAKISPPINNIEPLTPNDENPLIKAIINELGGKEIKKSNT